MISNDFQNYLNNQYLAHSPNDRQGGSFWDTLPQQKIQEQMFLDFLFNIMLLNCDFYLTPFCTKCVCYI